MWSEGEGEGMWGSGIKGSESGMVCGVRVKEKGCGEVDKGE